MQIRLINTCVDHDGQTFEDGAVVVAGEDIPRALAEQFLLTDRAELVLDDEPLSPDLNAAIEGFRQAFATLGVAVEVMVTAAEQAGPAGALAVFAAVREISESDIMSAGLLDRMEAVESTAKVEAARSLRGDADQVSTEGDEPNSSALGEAVRTSASDDAAPDGAPASDASGESPSGELASTDNPSEREPGPDAGPPAEASVSAEESAEGGEPVKASKSKSARAASKVEG